MRFRNNNLVSPANDSIFAIANEGKDLEINNE